MNVYYYYYYGKQVSGIAVLMCGLWRSSDTFAKNCRFGAVYRVLTRPPNYLSISLPKGEVEVAKLYQLRVSIAQLESRIQLLSASFS